MKPRKTHWFHCSQNDHGESWSVGLKTRPINVGPDEPTLPRLAVAKSVSQCFAARLFHGSVNVYRTERPRATIKPRGVYDACITGERWIVPPVKMVLVDTVSESDVDQIHRYLAGWIRKNRKGPPPLIRLYTYQRALNVLGSRYHMSWERRFVERSIEYFEEKEAI